LAALASSLSRFVGNSLLTSSIDTFAIGPVLVGNGLVIMRRRPSHYSAKLTHYQQMLSHLKTAHPDVFIRPVELALFSLKQPQYKRNRQVSFYILLGNTLTLTAFVALSAVNLFSGSETCVAQSSEKGSTIVCEENNNTTGWQFAEYAFQLLNILLMLYDFVFRPDLLPELDQQENEFVLALHGAFKDQAMPGDACDPEGDHTILKEMLILLHQVDIKPDVMWRYIENYFGAEDPAIKAINEPVDSITTMVSQQQFDLKKLIFGGQASMGFKSTLVDKITRETLLEPECKAELFDILNEFIFEIAFYVSRKSSKSSKQIRLNFIENVKLTLLKQHNVLNKKSVAKVTDNQFESLIADFKEQAKIVEKRINKMMVDISRVVTSQAKEYKEASQNSRFEGIQATYDFNGAFFHRIPKLILTFNGEQDLEQAVNSQFRHRGN
jgi:hypothetical protein